MFQGREVAAGWRSRGLVVAVALAGSAAGLSVVGVFLLIASAYQVRSESAVLLTVAAAAGVLSIREAIAARGTVTRMFTGANGAALREGAIARIASSGWVLVEEDRTQWSGATVYHLRLKHERRSVRAEIWSHGNRSRVVLRLKRIADAAELEAICSWFAAETAP